METLGQRIRMARGTLSQDQLCALTGIGKGSLGFYERDANTPRIDVVTKICSATGVSLQWLVTGDGPMRPELSSEAPHPKTPPLSPQPDDLIRIPMVEAVLSAGTGSLETNGQMGREYAFRRDFIQRKGNPANMVLMRVAGDSMQPEIMDKDVVLLDQSRKRLLPGPIFALGFEDAIYLKRVDKLPGQIILKSVNPEYEPIRIEMGEQTSELFRVIGQVLWVGREYK